MCACCKNILIDNFKLYLIKTFHFLLVQWLIYIYMYIQNVIRCCLDSASTVVSFRHQTEKI